MQINYLNGERATPFGYFFISNTVHLAQLSNLFSDNNANTPSLPKPVQSQKNNARASALALFYWVWTGVCLLVVGKKPVQSKKKRCVEWFFLWRYFFWLWTGFSPLLRSSRKFLFRVKEKPDCERGFFPLGRGGFCCIVVLLSSTRFLSVGQGITVLKKC